MTVSHTPQRTTQARASRARLRASFDARERHRLRRRALRLRAAWRQGQPQAEPRTALAVGAVEQFDAAAVRMRIFPRDREAETRALDAAFRRLRTLVERIENVLAM